MPESQVAVVAAVVPPRQRVAPEAMVRVPIPVPGPTRLVVSMLKTPAWMSRAAPAALLIVTADPILITVAAELMVSLWKVVAPERKVGEPEPEVTVTFEVPWVKVPTLVKRVPDVPVKVTVEALAVKVPPVAMVKKPVEKG